MDTVTALLAALPSNLQALWSSVSDVLALDVLDILRDPALPPDVKQQAMQDAVALKTQRAFSAVNPLLKTARGQAQDTINALLFKPMVSELNFECIYCKSRNTFVIARQSRSADESTPVKIVCRDCTKTYTERG